VIPVAARQRHARPRACTPYLERVETLQGGALGRSNSELAGMSAPMAAGAMLSTDRLISKLLGEEHAVLP